MCLCVCVCVCVHISVVCPCTMDLNVSEYSPSLPPSLPPLPPSLPPFLSPHTTQLFERLRNESPDAIHKVTPVVGDIKESELGLKKEDWEMLQDRVSIVFHLAATVRFETPLRYVVSLLLYLLRLR